MGKKSRQKKTAAKRLEIVPNQRTLSLVSDRTLELVATGTDGPPKNVRVRTEETREASGAQGLAQAAGDESSIRLTAREPMESGVEFSSGAIEDNYEEKNFFESEPPPMVEPNDEDLDPVATRRSQLEIQRASARRSEFSRYVKMAVSIGLGVLLVAGVRKTVLQPEQEVLATGPIVVPALVTPEDKVAAAPKAEEPALAAPVAVAPVAEAKVEPVKGHEPANTESARVAQASQAPVPQTQPSPVAAVAPDKGTKTALEEKRDAQRALDRGNNGAAIQAALRSVGVDPTDGEAWLILGAAYQTQGKIALARGAFSSCIKQAKRGPIAECRAMLN